jgi:calcium-dependent protein kinase
MQIKETILVYVSKNLQGAGDIMLIEELFRNLDTNKDGKLSKAELISGYSQIMEQDKATELVQSVMQTVDLDNSGFVDFSEFLFASSDPIFMLSNGNLRELFSLFDHDHDGTISLEEFERTMELSKASRSCWQEIIAQADVSGDGKLTLGEFSGLLKRAIGCDHRE